MENSKSLVPSTNALVAVSKGMPAVKLCTDKIIQFLTGGWANTQGWQWHKLDHMQTICTSLQTDDHTNTATLNFYRPHALPEAQPNSVKAIRLRNHKSAHHYSLLFIYCDVCDDVTE